MDWIKAVDIAVSLTNHGRYRWLCSEENPDIAQRDGYRRQVIEIAERGLPGFFEKYKNFATAVVHHAAAGFPRLSEKETEARLSICHACPQFHDRTCSLCGCNMRIKASWAEQDCPLGKWPKRNGEKEDANLPTPHSLTK